jgi:hypothetical protein
MLHDKKLIHSLDYDELVINPHSHEGTLPNLHFFPL